MGEWEVVKGAKKKDEIVVEYKERLARKDRLFVNRDGKLWLYTGAAATYLEDEEGRFGLELMHRFENGMQEAKVGPHSHLVPTMYYSPCSPEELGLEELEW